MLGVVQSKGVIACGNIAHNFPKGKLRAVIGVTLMGVGILMVGRLVICFQRCDLDPFRELMEILTTNPIHRLTSVRDMDKKIR